MKTQTTFQNASLVSVVNGSIVVKDSTGKEYTFTNASVVSVNSGTIVIESEWEPKEGELIKMEGNGTNCYAIFKNIGSTFLHDYGYKFFGGTQLIRNSYGWFTKNVTISPVTPEEQKEFDDFCKSQGKIWNKETLQWEKYKWKPKDGQIYYYIAMVVTTYVSYHTWRNDSIDNDHYRTKNYFKTEEEAKAVAEKIKKLLLEV